MSRISKISVIVLTKNEEAGLGNTLRRLDAFEEVIVVDSGSDDRTVEIALEHGARVVDFTWDGQYPKKKQWALDNARAANQWILLLDADEYPSPSLVRELASLESFLGDDGASAYDIDLTYRFAGRYLRFGHVVTKRSLLDSERARFPEVDDLDAPGIREVEGHYQPEVQGTVGHLKARIVHDDRDPVGSWFARHNRYSDWEAHLRLSPAARREIARKRTTKGRIFDLVPFKPVLFFVYAYFLRLGFLDRRAGFDYAVALATYYWQIGVKVRELSRPAEMESSSPEIEGADIGFGVTQFVNSLTLADGGPARNAVELNQALAGQGLHVQLVANTRGNESTALIDGKSWEGPAPLVLGDRNYFRTLFRSWNRSSVVILHGYYLPWVPVVAIVAFLSRKRVILMPHGALTAHDRRQSRGKKFAFDILAGWVVRRVVNVFAVGSNREATEMPTSRVRGKTHTVGVGTALRHAPVSARPAHQPVQLLALSRLAPKKRIDLCIDAIPLLAEAGVDAHLTVAGDGAGNVRTALEQRVKELDLEGRVTFAGLVQGNEKAKVLERADIFLLPSEDENFGIAVAEAAAAGLPIVASSYVASATQLSVSAAVILPTLSAEALAEGVQTILVGYSARRVAASLEAHQHFQWSSVARRWIALMFPDAQLPARLGTTVSTDNEA